MKKRFIQLHYKNRNASNLALSLSVFVCLRFLILSTKKGRKVKNRGETLSLFLSFHCVNISIVLSVGQHPAGTSDMKSNSF